MFITKGKKRKKVNDQTALKRDINAVKKNSIFGAFMLSYILMAFRKKKISLEFRKLYKGLTDGYKIPKNYGLIYSMAGKLIEKKGKHYILNLKKFIDSSTK